MVAFSGLLIWGLKVNGYADQDSVSAPANASLVIRHRSVNRPSSHGPVKRRSRVQRHRYPYVSLNRQMVYKSQLRPVDIPDACEAGSLQMALSIKGQARRLPLWRLVRRIGWYHNATGNGNPEVKYSGDPYYHCGATIYPGLMKRIARRYGVRSRVVDYAKPHTIIRNLLRRHPIVVEAGHHMEIYTKRGSQSDHVLCLIGYKKPHRTGYVQYTDPLYRHRFVRWCPFRIFWRAYNRPRITGDRALIIL